MSNTAIQFSCIVGGIFLVMWVVHVIMTGIINNVRK